MECGEQDRFGAIQSRRQFFQLNTPKLQRTRRTRLKVGALTLNCWGKIHIQIGKVSVAVYYFVK
jgi:hypothetical protein